MSTKWKLQEVLERHNVSGYKLAKMTKGHLSRTQIYTLTNTDSPKAIYLETLDVILNAMHSLGHEVQVSDLLEHHPDTESLFDKSAS